MKRVVSILLSLCMVLSLAACGKGGGKGENSPPPELENNLPYVYSDLGLPLEADYFAGLKADGDKLYVLSAVQNEEYTMYTLSGMEQDGSGSYMIQSTPAIYDFDFDSTGNLHTLWTSEEGVMLSRFSGDQEVEKTEDVTDIIATGMYPAALGIDREDLIYVTAHDQKKTMVYVFEPDLSLSFELELEGMPLDTVTTSEGAYGVCAYDMSAVNTESMNFELRFADPKTKGWSDDTIATGMTQGLYKGRTAGFYSNDGANVYSFDLETGESSLLFSWIEVGLAPTMALLCELPEGGFAVISGVLGQEAASYDYSFGIITNDGTQRDERQVLTLAALIPDATISAAVTKFNKENEEYKIEVNTYLSNADIMGTLNIEDALLQFNTDIITGNIPDMINLTNMPVDLYTAKGILEDLYPYIDADPDFSRDDIFENVLEALSVKGELPYITNGIFLFTLFTDSRIIDAEDGLSAEDLAQALRDHPEYPRPFGASMTKELFLTYILYGNLDLIDWETGECRFDTPEFMSLLELANLLSDEGEEVELDMTNLQGWLDSSARIADGEQLAAVEQILSVEQVAAYVRALGDNLNIAGLPGQGDPCHVIDAILKLGISAKSEHKDAAWEFVRLILLETASPNNLMIPINREAFAKRMEDTMDGKSLLQMYYPGLEVEQEDAEVLRKLIESAHYSSSYDQVIIDIVTSEAAAYFDGSVTVERAAEVIQSRIRTYVNEQS